MLHNFELHKCKKPINPNFGNQIKIKEMKNKNKNKVERRLEQNCARESGTSPPKQKKLKKTSQLQNASTQT